MSACRVTPEATYLEPLVGWRFWRVERIATLDHGTRFRLCAAGRYGRPKVWQPRVATVAVCSDRDRNHDAPHPRHECGIYAYLDREAAEAKLVSMETYRSSYAAKKADKWNPDPTPTYETWAVGRVSLWGRVVECELGWRAQFAYPYDLTVYTNGRAGDTIAADYAIDAVAVPRHELKWLLAAHQEAAKRAKADAEYDDWYDKTIFGRMDRYFLKPYHEKTMGRLDLIESRLKALTVVANGAAKEVDSDAG